MPRVNHFAIPADVPERAIQFYQEVFGWQFELGWEYETPEGREKYWHVITGGGSAGIDGGLARREYQGQPISRCCARMAQNSVFGIRISFGLRASDFGFGKANHRSRFQMRP